MPRTLRWASIILALIALEWAVVVLLGTFVDPVGTADARPAQRVVENELDVPGVRIALILSVVQVAMCVLVRAGWNSARVVLTVSAFFLGLVELVVVISGVLDYLDVTERAAARGWVVEVSGLGILTLVITVLAVVFTVIGLVLLHRPSTNAYFTDVRRLRRDALRRG